MDERVRIGRPPGLVAAARCIAGVQIVKLFVEKESKGWGA
jgi:hypothetical protein